MNGCFNMVKPVSLMVRLYTYIVVVLGWNIVWPLVYIDAIPHREKKICNSTHFYRATKSGRR